MGEPSTAVFQGLSWLVGCYRHTLGAVVQFALVIRELSGKIGRQQIANEITPAPTIVDAGDGWGAKNGESRQEEKLQVSTCVWGGWACCVHSRRVHVTGNLPSTL